MSFVNELKSSVNSSDVSEEEKYYMLLHQMKSIANVPKERATEILCEALNYTGSWIGIVELQSLLHEEDFSKIESKVIKKIRTRYGKALKDHPETINQVEQDLIPQDLKEIFFAIVKSEQGYVLKEAPYGLETYAFDAEKIQVENLKKVVIIAMQKHLESGVFYDRGTRKAKWIQEILSNTINCLASNEDKDKVVD